MRARYLTTAYSLVLVGCGISQRTVEERADNAGDGGGLANAGAGGSSSSSGTASFGGFGNTVGTPPFGTAGAIGFQPPMPPGPAAGGRATVGGAPGLVCAQPFSFAPTCMVGPEPPVELGGAGGADACSANSSAGSNASAGAESEGGSAGDASVDVELRPRVLIDDLEDGDVRTFPVLGGQGDWFAVNDGSGQQFPMPCAISSLTENGRAMHTYGQGFFSQAGGYSLLGFSLRSERGGCMGPVDASHYTGIEFLARGDGVLRVFIGTTATNPTADLGTCSGACYDAHGVTLNLTPGWGLHRIPFRYLAQEGWGSIAPFDPAQILAVSWSAKIDRGSIVPSSCFDFWIDDVAFYRE